MKLCKDCSRYAPKHFIIFDGKLAWTPEWCSKTVGDPDAVTGVFARVGDPAAARKDEALCGKDGRWFEPGTLDGRLAMLDEPSPPKEIEVEHSGD